MVSAVKTETDTVETDTVETDTSPILFFSGEYAWLSNFWQSPVTTTDGRTYATLEAAYHAQKCELESEKDQLTKIRWGADAKAFGRIVKLRKGWDGDRVEVMGDLLQTKFADPDLRDRLIATGERELVHGVKYTSASCLFWGSYQSDGGPVPRGTGENWLGLLIMSVREAVR